MMRLACVLALPLVVLLVVACGGGAEEPPDPDSFEDGLTAQEIIERSNEAMEDQQLLRSRKTETMEFLGSRSTRVTETAVAFENFHTITTDEDRRTEIVRLDGVDYLREAEDGEWERIDYLDAFATAKSEFDDAFELADAVDDSQLVRLRDGEIEGRTMMKVRMSGVSRSDAEDGMASLCEALGEEVGATLTCLPPALTPNETESTLIVWIGADDFLSYRLEGDVLARRDGEEIAKIEQVIEIFDYGERIVIPDPLAD